MDWRERITADPRVLVGKPVVKGTRLSVEFLLGIMGDGWSTEDILDNYPRLTLEDLRACLKFASEVVAKERVLLSPA
jgi:uncharacterized protein (DUF433 family)